MCGGQLLAGCEAGGDGGGDEEAGAAGRLRSLAGLRDMLDSSNDCYQCAEVQVGMSCSDMLYIY